MSDIDLKRVKIEKTGKFFNNYNSNLSSIYLKNPIIINSIFY